MSLKCSGSRSYARTTFVLGSVALLSCLPVALPGAESPAEQTAQRYWEKAWTKCGDSYYEGSYVQVTEFPTKNVTFKVTSQTVEEADKLNGIEWQGVMVATPTVHRVIWLGDPNNPPYMSKPSVGRWEKPPFPIVRALRKVQGRWFVPRHYGYDPNLPSFGRDPWLDLETFSGDPIEGPRFDCSRIAAALAGVEAKP